MGNYMAKPTMRSLSPAANAIILVLVGTMLAGALAVAMSWLWPGTQIPAFMAFIFFLLAWVLTSMNTVAHKQRNPEVFEGAGWVKPRYKASHLEKNEFAVSRMEFIRGGFGVIFLGVPLCLLLAGLVGIIWPISKWHMFLVFFALWVAKVVLDMVRRLMQ
jgi:hypothetical protein